MNSLIEYMNILDKIIDNGHYLEFRQGVSDDDVSKINSILKPQRLSVELETLYKWKNGCITESFDDIPALGFRLLPFEESLIVLNEYKSNTIFDEKRYLPIGDMDGALILALLDSEEVFESEVCVFLFEEDSLYLWHESITKLIQTSINICSVEDNNGETYDDVRLKYSPNAEVGFW